MYIPNKKGTKMTQKTQDEFYESLAQGESSGRWNIENPYGYLGAFQKWANKHLRRQGII